jgi:hypothetical protein
MRGDVRWGATLAETCNTVDPAGRDARCNFARWLDDERQGGLLLQQPEPFARRSESVANRSYAEELFCSFERFRLLPFGERNATNRTIELDRFFPRDQLDPRYFNAPYGGRIGSAAWYSSSLRLSCVGVVEACGCSGDLAHVAAGVADARARSEIRALIVRMSHIVM